MTFLPSSWSLSLPTGRGRRRQPNHHPVVADLDLEAELGQLLQLARELLEALLDSLELRRARLVLRQRAPGFRERGLGLLLRRTLGLQGLGQAVHVEAHLLEIGRQPQHSRLGRLELGPSGRVRGLLLLVLLAKLVVLGDLRLHVLSGHAAAERRGDQKDPQHPSIHETTSTMKTLPAARLVRGAGEGRLAKRRLESTRGFAPSSGGQAPPQVEQAQAGTRGATKAGGPAYDSLATLVAAAADPKGGLRKGGEWSSPAGEDLLRPRHLGVTSRCMRPRNALGRIGQQDG
jgi:hypothetical protein